LVKGCTALKVDIGDVMEIVPDIKLQDIIIIEELFKK